MTSMPEKKHRLLIVGPYPPPYSGPDVQMKTILGSSIRDRFDITFLNTNIRSSNAQRGKLDLSAAAAILRFYLRLIRLLIGRRPALVYYYVTATKAGWLGRDIWCIFLSRLAGTKIVIHMRAGHFKSGYLTWPFWVRWLVKAACGRVALGVVQGDALRNQFAGLVPEKRIRTLYNTVDTETYVNHSPEPNYHKRVFFMGHLSCAKGYCDVLAAIPEVARRHPEVEFVFAGTKLETERNVFLNQLTGEPIGCSHPEESLETLRNDGYGDHYRYVGVVSESEKLELLATSSIFLLPSYSEGFSQAVLEAMSMARPVICTPVGALGEVVRDGENGFLVMPGDVDAMVRRIDRLLSDPDLQARMARTNHHYTRRRFAVERVAGQLGDLFEAVIAADSK